MKVTKNVNILGDHFIPNGKTCHSYNFPLHLNLRNILDPGTHRDLEEGILEIQPRTHGALLEPFPEGLKFFHM